MSEDARHDTVRRARVLASSTARTVTGEEDVRRVRVGVRKREGGWREGGKGTREREREERKGGKARKEAATLSSNSRRPDAHRLSGVTLEKERRAREGGGGMRGCVTERHADGERRDDCLAADVSDSLGDL